MPPATKLEMMQKINELISAYNSLKNNVTQLVSKLNDDPGVSNIDYEENSDIAPIELETSDQLINRRQ